MCSGPQLYCQKFIRAQEWENIVFRLATGKAKQGSDVFGGFSPSPMCLFIFRAIEWSRMSAEPPFAHCPAPTQSQPPVLAAAGQNPWENRAAPCAWGLLWLQTPTVPALGSLKQLFLDLPGFKQETVVPTRGHLQWRIKEAFISYHSCNSCSFKGCPAGCSSQPHPTQHLQTEIKHPPFAGHFPHLGSQTLLPFSPGLCQHPAAPAGHAHLRLVSNS